MDNIIHLMDKQLEEEHSKTDKNRHFKWQDRPVQTLGIDIKELSIVDLVAWTQNLQ